MLTKFEVSPPSHFQDIAVQNYPFLSYFSVAILSVLWQKINFLEKWLKFIEKQLILLF